MSNLDKNATAPLEPKTGAGEAPAAQADVKPEIKTPAAEPAKSPAMAPPAGGKH
jgi:hypothetical protein